MKLHILILALLFLLGVVVAEEQTTLTFLVEYEDEQQEDYIELGLVISAEGTSLVSVMTEALKIGDEIKQIATQFCLAHAKKKADCKDIVEIGHSDIKPKYQVVKRQSKFMGFQVEHKVNIKVIAIDHISDLADTILKEKNTKIVSFEWKPLEEVNKEEAAVKQGTQDAQELCEQIGMHLESILSVEQMTESATEETVVYKFQVECLPGKRVKKVQKQAPKAAKQTKPEAKKSEVKQEKKEKKEKKPEGKTEKKPQTKKSQDKKPEVKKAEAKKPEVKKVENKSTNTTATKSSTASEL